MMKKASIIGHFGKGCVCLDGQTVKTKTFAYQLGKIYGIPLIKCYDTHGGKKTLLKSPAIVLSALQSSENVIILPAHKGLRVIAPLLVGLNRLFHRRLHYVVIGGWLPQMLEGRKFLSRVLKRFDHIYVETNVMKQAMEAQGFDNITVMPNCKDLPVLSESDLVYPADIPYRLCTFSRVMKEKGIEDAVNAVKTINEKYGRTVFTLDIYGQVESQQASWFENLQKSFPPYICYCGTVAFDESVSVVKNYFALLFPTRFYTEGIPGTIIDAYAAGVPVIASRWESFSDIISAGVTGLGYEFGQPDKLAEILERLVKGPELLTAMKKACIAQAADFFPCNVIKTLQANM